MIVKENNAVRCQLGPEGALDDSWTLGPPSHHFFDSAYICAITLPLCFSVYCFLFFSFNSHDSIKT